MSDRAAEHHVNGGRGRLVRNLARASKADGEILVQWCHLAAKMIEDLRAENKQLRVFARFLKRRITS